MTGLNEDCPKDVNKQINPSYCASLQHATHEGQVRGNVNDKIMTELFNGANPAKQTGIYN